MSSSSFEKIGVSPWLSNQLKAKNNFTSPLPVQSAVVPFATKAFSSWLLHCDIGLSAPTGSGKTLCYCLPVIQAIIAQKTKRFAPTPTSNDRHIRGVIVVPSSILAEQVNDVLTTLLLTNQQQGNKKNNKKQHHQNQKKNKNEDQDDDQEDAAVENKEEETVSDAPPEFAIGTLFRAADDGSDLFRKSTSSSSTQQKKYFGTVDILVATPQKLCSWIERLADDDDEEEQKQFRSMMMAATSSNSSAEKQQQQQKTSTTSKLVDIFGRTQVVVLDEADDLLSTGFFTSMAGRIVETINDAVQQKGETVLHKMLCSATLTARISKVSDVKLQNAKYFSLDATGHEILGASALSTGSAAGAVQNTVSGDIIRQKFPLPSSLSEHLVIVRDDSKRHVTLLNVVRYALEDLKKTREEKERQARSEKIKDAAAGGGTSDEDDNTAVTNSNIPSWKTTGSSIIVFCQTAEVARVLGHFLSVAGIDALELTTLTSDAERRQAALAVAAAKSTEQKVVVASDALMRGVDLPGVGAVIMYDPPTTLQQYVHRVGRTARAGADGHSYVLLSKVGASGNEEDGQVALFKSFDNMLLRKGKVSNLVKLRELNPEEVQVADELLMKTRARLQQQQQHNPNPAKNVAAAAAATKTQQQQQKKDSGKRRGRN